MAGHCRSFLVNCTISYKPLDVQADGEVEPVGATRILGTKSECVIMRQAAIPHVQLSARLLQEHANHPLPGTPGPAGVTRRARRRTGRIDRAVTDRVGAR